LRQDLCEGALMCHWCGPQHGRCKPRRATGYVGWRREVECDTSSCTASGTAMPQSSTLTTFLSQSMSTSGTGVATVTSTLQMNSTSHPLSMSEKNISGSISLSPETMRPSWSYSCTISVSPFASLSTSRSPTLSTTHGDSVSPSLYRTLSATLKFCSCSGAVAAGHVALMRDEANSTAGPNATVVSLMPIAVAADNAEDPLMPQLLRSAIVDRQTMWASSHIAVTLSLQSKTMVSASTTLETLCWRPVAASLRGAALQITAKRAPPLPDTDTVSWALLLSYLPSPDSVATSPLWLPTSIAAYADVTLLVDVVLRCGAGDPHADGGERLLQQRVTIVMAVAGLPQQLAEEVQSSARSAQLLAALVVSGGGTAVGRVMALRAVVMCSSGDAAAAASGGPLGLVVSGGCDDRDGALPAYRGTIVGNLVMILAVATAALLLALLLLCVNGGSFLAALKVVAFPSCLHPVWVIALPSTATATAQLIAGSTGCVADAICASLGLVILLGPLGVLTVLVQRVPAVAVAVPRIPAPTASLTCAAIMRGILRPRWAWVLVGKGADDGRRRSTTTIRRDHVLRHSWFVLLEHRRLSYAVLDVVVLEVVGLLVAVSGHGPDSQCTTAGVLVGVCCAAQFIVCAAASPFTTLLSFGASLFSLFFTTLSAILQLSMFSIAGDTNTAALLLRLSLAAAICDLLVIGVSVARTVRDLIELATALIGLLTARCSLSTLAEGEDFAEAESNGDLSECRSGTSAGNAALSPAAVLPNTSLDAIPLEAATSFDVDHLFWDEFGNAVPLRCYDDEIVPEHSDGLQRALGTRGVNAGATRTWMEVI
jgi:hypothetical protein